ASGSASRRGSRAPGAVWRLPAPSRRPSCASTRRRAPEPTRAPTLRTRGPDGSRTAPRRFVAPRGLFRKAHPLRHRRVDPPAPSCRLPGHARQLCPIAARIFLQRLPHPVQVGLATRDLDLELLDAAALALEGALARPVRFEGAAAGLG